MDIERQIGAGQPDRAVEEEAPPSVVINPHSEYGKELRKWEQHPSELTPRGTRPGNPYVYRPYPRMLYRARRHPRSGQPCVLQSQPTVYEFDNVNHYERAMLEVESWNASAVLIVPDESRERLAMGQGWCESPQAALEVFEREQQAIERAAAEMNYRVARMSEPAQREHADADAATHEHVVDIQPRKRGHKPKVVTGSGPVES